MFVIGIDPGLTGGIAIFGETGLLQVFDMPQQLRSTKRVRNKRTGQMQDKNTYEINSCGVAEIIYPYVKMGIPGEVQTYIEQVGAVYRQDGNRGGVGQPLHATFVFGQGYGQLIATCEIYCGKENVHRVAPISWKKHLGLVGTEKDAARLYAIENIPSAEPFLKRKKDIGRADAMLIGKYGVDKCIQ